MKLKNLIFASFTLFLTIGLMTSCSKDDLVEDDMKEEPIEIEFRMEINGKSLVTDAFAEYCSVDGVEFLSVSNKEILLDTVINSNDFEVNDFLFLLADTDDGDFQYGGAVFDTEISGSNVTQVIFTPDVTIDIISNDGSIVDGSMEGTFLGLDDNLEPTIVLPFTVTFTADIVGESEFCE